MMLRLLWWCRSDDDMNFSLRDVEIDFSNSTHRILSLFPLSAHIPHTENMKLTNREFVSRDGECFIIISWWILNKKRVIRRRTKSIILAEVMWDHIKRILYTPVPGDYIRKCEGWDELRCASQDVNLIIYGRRLWCSSHMTIKFVIQGVCASEWRRWSRVLRWYS